MKRVNTAGVMLVALAAMLMAFAGPAAAKRRCALSARSKLIPTLKSPCNKATVAKGHEITFTVVDKNSQAHKYHPYIELSRKGPNARGRLPQVPPAGGFYDKLRQVKGHPQLWYDRPKQYSFPGWWNITPGTYYVQIQQIDDRAGVGETFYSPVSKITVK